MTFWEKFTLFTIAVNQALFALNSWMNGKGQSAHDTTTRMLLRKILVRLEELSRSSNAAEKPSAKGQGTVQSRTADDEKPDSGNS